MESKDDTPSSILLPVTFCSLCFSSSRLMSLLLSQLIRCDDNLVDLWGVSTKSCRVDFTIDDDKEDDGKNDGGINDPFNDSNELVAISVEAAELTEVVGDKGGAFLMEAKQK
jgi:hypothetical protein